MDEHHDDAGIAEKKSQLQIQIAVNRHHDELERKLLDALPSLAALDPTLTWASPVEADQFREYRDGELLARIGLSDLRDALKEYWPPRGPVWDSPPIGSRLPAR